MSAYLIPAGHGQAELIEKKSRFIGRVWHVTSEEEALTHIKEMRSQHWDATHNVYAYIIGQGEMQMRYSDDGEPSGTSGMPTLNVFRSEGISEVCCVITRYFGGTLLGAGGLVRAYSAAAKLALDAAGIQRMDMYASLMLSCSYAQYERVRKLAEDMDSTILHADFGADVLLELITPESKEQAFVQKVTELTAGSVMVEHLGTCYQGVKIR